MPTATLLPTSDESSAGTLVLSSGAAHWSLLDDDDGGTNHIRFDSDGFVSMNYSDMPKALTVNSVTVTVSYSSVGAYDTQVGKAFLKIGGTKYYGTDNNLVVSTAYDTFWFTWLKNPATGAAWTNVAVNALIAGVEMTGFTANSARFSYAPITVDYVALPVSVDVTRHVSTVALHTLRQPEIFVKFSGNLDVLGTDESPLELLGDAQMEHPAGPIAEGAGWEPGTTTRRAVSPHLITVNPMEYSADVDFKDIRNLKALVWFPAFSNKNSGALEDGIPRMMTPGATFTFTRAMTETFTDPVGDSVTVAANVPGYADGGLQILAGASVTRAWFSNNEGARTVNAAQGALGCEVKFLGTLAEDRVIHYCYHDSSNWLKVFYEHASGKIKFSLRVAGTTTTVSALAGAAVDTWYQVEVYWSGLNQENDHTEPSIALYIDRVLQEVAVMNGTTADLVINGGAESGLASWTTSGTVTAQTTSPRTGTYHFLFGTTGSPSMSQDLTAIAGRSLVVSAYCAVSSATRHVRVRLQNLDTGNYYNGATNAWESASVDIGSTNATSYTLVTETLTVEGTSGSASLRLTIYSPAPGGITSARADDVSAVIDLGGSAMVEAASSNFDIGSEAGSNQLRGLIRKIVSLPYVPTPHEMQRSL